MARKASLSVCLVLVAAAAHAKLVPVSSSGGVLSGAINNAPEWVAPYVWGDGSHDLLALWSAGFDDASGYAYGTSVGSDVDVYNAGVVDPLTVANAASFLYTDGYIDFTEGETLFFRGANGYYGAWVVGDLFVHSPHSNGHGPQLFMDGTWYFQPDGSADFTASVATVPEPSGALLAALGIGAVAMLRRRR